MVYKYFDKKSAGSGVTTLANNEQLAELHKPIIRNIRKRTFYSTFKDNICSLSRRSHHAITFRGCL